ncbi:hypothetical protein H0H87_006487 [Tephrocybe sp. NHM501043]|nr:hypothetical protein H0H87_006487 [Tephrocybe sp. NHM501043]
MASKTILGVFLALGAGLLLQVGAYDNSRSDNGIYDAQLAVYFGQGDEKLSSICKDDTIDAIPLAFLSKYFGKGGLPELDSICSADPFPGTRLANCKSLSDDIKACQAKGKIVTLSLGGADGKNNFETDAEAEKFADTVWDLFLGGDGGKDSVRPFGDAVLDGIDFDIEQGTTAKYDAFVKRIQSKAKEGKKVYITAAPQCPYPDKFLGEVLDAVAFDAVYVQYIKADFFIYYLRDKWAKTKAVNKDVKVFIGAPASKGAADFGYVSATTLAKIAAETKEKYSSFGGVMLWDSTEALGELLPNDGFDKKIKAALKKNGGGSGLNPDEEGSDDPSTKKRSIRTGSCGSVDAWAAGTAVSIPFVSNPFT